MARTIVQLPADGTGKKLDAVNFTSPNGTDGTVYANTFVLCDSSGNIIDSLATTPVGTERALPTRQVGGVSINGTVPITDNSGSLTVDAPVATPVFTRLSDGAAALIGQKAAASSLPVVLASDQVLDVSDDVTRELGRVRVWDGTNELDLSTQRGVQDKANNAVPIEKIVGIRPTFQVALPEITLATTTGDKQIFTMFKGATPDVDIHIIEIMLTVRTATTAGGSNVQLQYITAENGTPGGTALAANIMGLHDRTATTTLNTGSTGANGNVRSVVTGLPTTTGQIFHRRGFSQNALAYEVPVFKATGFEEAIRLRALNAEGITCTVNVGTALTGAPIVTGYIRWIEL